MAYTEAQIHTALCDYVKMKYPDVIFRTDFSSGVKMTPGQAVRHKRLQSGRAFVDLFFYEPRAGYSGLALEVKKDGVRVQTKDGKWVSNPHIQEQAIMLHQLGSRGYLATFGIGFEHCRGIIDEYLALPKPNYTPPPYNVQFPDPPVKPTTDPF